DVGVAVVVALVRSGPGEQRGGLLGLVGRADPDRGRLPQAAGAGEHLRGGLADRAVDVVDQDENFCHGDLLDRCDGQTSLREARKATRALPPSPSSVTISPLVRGGRASTDSTFDHAASRPTWEGSMPRSASVQVCTGFFLAAMIPLNEG